MGRPAMGLALLDVADVIRPHPEVVAFLQGVEDDGLGLLVCPDLDLPADDALDLRPLQSIGAQRLTRFAGGVRRDREQGIEINFRHAPSKPRCAPNPSQSKSSGLGATWASPNQISAQAIPPLVTAAARLAPARALTALPAPPPARTANGARPSAK